MPETGWGGMGGQGDHCPPPIFGRSVNPIPTRGGQIIPTYCYCPPPKFSHLLTSLHEWNGFISYHKCCFQLAIEGPQRPHQFKSYSFNIHKYNTNLHQHQFSFLNASIFLKMKDLLTSHLIIPSSYSTNHLACLPPGLCPLMFYLKLCWALSNDDLRRVEHGKLCHFRFAWQKFSIALFLPNNKCHIYS